MPTSSMPPAAAVRQPEKRTIVQLVLGVVILILGQLALPLGAILGLMLSGPTDSAVNVGEALAGGGLPSILALGLSAAVAIIGFILVIRFVSARPVHEFSSAGAGRELGWGVLIGFVVIAVGMGILALTGVYRVSGVQLVPGIIGGIMLGVGPAALEEVFFRGFLLRLLDRWWGSWVALAVVSVLFALVHAASSPAGPIAALWVFLLASLLLNMAWLLTRRLWLPIGIHFAINATQSAVFGTNVSGNAASASLLQGHLVGPDWLTGGVAGAEGSLPVIVVGLAIGVAMLVRGIRAGVMLAPQRRLDAAGAAMPAQA